MAEGRMIKKRISTSRKIASVKDSSGLLYFMMYPHADVEGRIEGCPKIIKGQMLTYFNWKEDKIQKCLEDLHNARLIILYVIDGNQYVEFTRFEDFQTLNPEREAKSIIPAPTPESSRVTPENSLLSKDKLSKDKISKERASSFIKPTIEEIKAYCQERNNKIDPQAFFDHYETRGWIPKGYTSQMKDWKAAVRTWEKRSFLEDKPKVAENKRGHEVWKEPDYMRAKHE